MEEDNLKDDDKELGSDAILAAFEHHDDDGHDVDEEDVVSPGSDEEEDDIDDVPFDGDGCRDNF